ncbi:MAG: riboflavin synthase [Gammaproteobacteria bacterium]|nr:riboflavin synthase [Gammaproteobacteria bacterium]
MFTGLIDHCGTIFKLEEGLSSQRIWISSAFTDLVLGESIAVDGICLTVTEMKEGLFSCDVSRETQHVTTAGAFQLHQQVNLERALQLSARLGGHMVSGHVDQTCQLAKRQNQEAFIEMFFGGLDSQMQRYIMKKGSVAINGVSLTINTVSADGFSIMLIPHTIQKTNLGNLKAGDNVNIEFDMIAKMIVEQYQKYPNPNTVAN